jgi:hypothetical protein
MWKLTKRVSGTLSVRWIALLGKERSAMKKELASTWCCLNDPGSWYHKKWTKDEIWGAMKIISQFVDEKTRLAEWDDYHSKKKEKF